MTGNEKNYICPLLKNPAQYKPDTVDLVNNVKARNYWLPCLEQMIKKCLDKAKYLNQDAKVTERADLCYEKFRNLIQQVIVDPSVVQPLSVRVLLEFHEDNLRANNFKDSWLLQKRNESSHALSQFKDRIDYIDSIDDFDRKWLELTEGVVAGNFFDWGASAVTNILEHTQNFSLSDALAKIQKRPWFCDKLDEWIARLKKRPYKTCVIFVDNCGVDFILGILPMTRQLLMLGTKVILAANSLPALNDITLPELNLYCSKASQYCNILKDALVSKQLITTENGQRGPCLDLRNIPTELCALMKPVDLVILEGMGRAVHTNLYAKFKIDSVKMAVVKNEWLAQSMGAPQFAVIVNYEQASSLDA